MRKLKHEEIARADPSEVISLPKHPISVVVNDLRSVHNVGALFRTADALALAHLYLCGHTGTPANHALRKTALGAEETVSWSYHADALMVIETLRASGHTLAVLEITDDPTPVESLTASAFPLALVVGNEVDGVDDGIVERADLALEIAQYGAKQSLNVSVAFGIMAADLVRVFRRGRTLGQPRR